MGEKEEMGVVASRASKTFPKRKCQDVLFQRPWQPCCFTPHFPSIANSEMRGSPQSPRSCAAVLLLHVVLWRG